MKITSVLMSGLLLLGCVCAGQSFAQEGQNEVKILNAEIISMDPDEGVLTVIGGYEAGELEGKEITLNVTDETVIFFEDEEIEIYDLITGDSLIIEHYTGEAGDIVVTKIHLEYDMTDAEEMEVNFE
jgi:hypothetical protein